MYHMFHAVRLMVAMCLLLLARRAEGQTLSVRPIQDLSFGFLLAGVPTSIAPNDFTRSGQVELTAPLGTSFEIRYTLPTAMSGVGTTLPLAFGSTSVGAAPSSSPASMQFFDPANALRFQLTTSARVTFFLGGQAIPSLGQPVGTYSAPIVITITNLGI